MFDNGSLSTDVISISDVQNLLNQQDIKIKELEQETYPAYKREHQRRAYLENIEVPKLKAKIKELEEENQKLKQSQNSKAIEELSNLKATLVNDVSPILLSYSEYVDKVFETINSQIKELRGNNNE